MKKTSTSPDIINLFGNFRELFHFSFEDEECLIKLNVTVVTKIGFLFQFILMFVLYPSLQHHSLLARFSKSKAITNLIVVDSI